MKFVPETEPVFMHEQCLSEKARAHIWEDGKVSRLTNVNNEIWATFKASCKAAFDAAQKAESSKKANASKKTSASTKASKVVDLTTCRKTKKANKGLA